MRVILELPGAVRGKGSGRAFVVRGKNKATGQTFDRAAIFTDSKTRSYEAQLKTVGAVAMQGAPPIDGPVRVVIETRFPVPKSWSKRDRAAALAGDIRPITKPDWDNVGKSCDGLNLIIWVDDKQICDGRVIKVYSEHPGVTIIVETLERRRVPAQDGGCLPLFGT